MILAVPRPIFLPSPQILLCDPRELLAGVHQKSSYIHDLLRFTGHLASPVLRTPVKLAAFLHK